MENRCVYCGSIVTEGRMIRREYEVDIFDYSK